MGGTWSMINKVVFYLEESPYHPGMSMIAVHHDMFHLTGTKGSYHLIQARLMNLPYAQYLRMCRDVCGAEIIGKNSMYPVAYFKDKNKAKGLVNLLNSRATLVLWEREHPDWEEHQEKVKEFNKKKAEFKELIAK